MIEKGYVYFFKTGFKIPRFIYTVFVWSTDYKQCQGGRIRGVGNAAIEMEQKYVKIGTSVCIHIRSYFERVF